MIERQKAKYDWEFLFFGANIDGGGNSAALWDRSLTGLSITTLTALDAAQL